MRISRKWAIIALTAGGLVASLGLTSASWSAPDKLTKVDIAKPGAVHDYMVWRNGKFYKITVRLHEYETLRNGKSSSPRQVVASDDSADMAREAARLPPQDPAWNDVNPTSQQMADMNVALGNNPDGSPSDAQTAAIRQAVAAEGGPAAAYRNGLKP